MKIRKQKELINEINQEFSANVSKDAKFTIYTIRNLIESNTRVEESVDQLHRSINTSNKENERLQKRIWFLTIVTVALAMVQALAVIVELLK